MIDTRFLSKWIWIWIGSVLSLGILFNATPALAHKVTVFAWVEGRTIHTESKFSAGKPAQGAKIEVYNARGQKLLEGLTDQKGLFDFPVPEKSDLKIVLIAGMGHANEWWVRADEIDDGPPAAGVPAAAPAAAPLPPAETPPPAALAAITAPGNAANSLDAATVRQIVNQALERKLAPLEEKILQPGWQWHEVISGLGYILGLMGLASYMRFRKQKSESGR